jgi:hypothetical protein
MGFEKIEVQEVKIKDGIIIVKPERELQISYANRGLFATLITHALEDSFVLWVKTNNFNDKEFLNEFVSTKTYSKLEQQQDFYTDELSYKEGNSFCYVFGNKKTSFYIQANQCLKFLKAIPQNQNISIQLKLDNQDKLSLDTDYLRSGLITINGSFNDLFFIAKLCDDTSTKSILLPKASNPAKLFHNLPLDKALYAEFNNKAITKISSTKLGDDDPGRLTGNFQVITEDPGSGSQLWLLVHQYTGICVNLGITAFYRLPYHFESGDYFSGEIQFSDNKWVVTQLKGKSVDAYKKNETIELQYVGESVFYKKYKFFIFLDLKTQNKYRLSKSQFTGRGDNSPYLYISKIQENTKFVVSIKCKNSIQANDLENHLHWYLTEKPTAINDVQLVLPFASEVTLDSPAEESDWVREKGRLSFGISALGVSVKIFTINFLKLGIYKFDKLAKVKFDLSKSTSKLDWNAFTIDDIGKFEFGKQPHKLTLLHHKSFPHEHVKQFDNKLFYKNDVVTCFDYSADITLLVYLSQVILNNACDDKTLDSNNVITAVIKNLYHPDITRQPFVAKCLRVEIKNDPERIESSKLAKGTLEVVPIREGDSIKFKLTFKGTLEGEEPEDIEMAIPDSLLNLVPESKIKDDLYLSQIALNFNRAAIEVKFDHLRKIIEIPSIYPVSNIYE